MTSDERGKQSYQQEDPLEGRHLFHVAHVWQFLRLVNHYFVNYTN